MKLVIFTNTYPYRGGEPFLDEEISILVNFYNDISVVPLHCGTAELRQMPQGVKLIPPILSFSPDNSASLISSGVLNFSPIGNSFRYFFSPLIFSGKKFESFFSYFMLERALLSHIGPVLNNLKLLRSDDIVFYFYWGDKSIMLLPYLKRRFPDSKAIVRFHGKDLFEEVSGCIPFREKIFPHIDMAIPISEEGKRYLLSKYADLIPEQKVRVSYLGVKDYKLRYRYENSSVPLEIESPFGKFVKNEKPDFHIVSCSDLVPMKRVDLIMKSLSLISEKELESSGYGRIVWSHIGDGPAYEALKEESEKINRSHLVMEFKGKMHHGNVMNFYRKNKIDLFIQLSESEGIPVPMMESLCFGIPVISTNVGGVSEIVNNDIGALLPADPSITEVKDVILSYMNLNNDIKERIRENARKSYDSKWDADNNYTEFAAIINSVAMY